MCERSSINGLTHPTCHTKYTIDGVFSILYYSKVAHILLYAFKYKPYVSDLTDVLVDLFYEGLIQNEMFNKILDKQNNILVPIPLHSNKYRRRGYNHAELLSTGLGKKLGLRMETSLVRVKNTRSQFTLDKKQRSENMKDAFSVRTIVKGKTIFVVDDLVTTGSTLREATKVLKQNGATNVWAVTLFRG